MLNPLNKQVAELTKSFDAMARDVRAKAADAIAEAVLLMESGAKLKTPVQTGRLRANNRGLFDKSKLSGVLFNNVEYGPTVEYGIKRKAKPFFFPAADKGQQELIEELKKIIKNAKLP